MAILLPKSASRREKQAPLYSGVQISEKRGESWCLRIPRMQHRPQRRSGCFNVTLTHSFGVDSIRSRVRASRTRGTRPSSTFWVEATMRRLALAIVFLLVL